MSKEKEMAGTFNEIEQEKMRQRYNALKTTYNQNVDSNANQQIAQAQSSAGDQLRQAYVNNIQNQRQVQNNLAKAGIRGGMTETANMNLANAYGNQRGQINSDMMNSINQINQTALQNKQQYALETDSAMREAFENREAEDRANAREDKQIAKEDKLVKRQQNTEKFTAKYSKYYSVDKLKKLRKKAKTSLEKQIIDARIGFIRSHKKGY